MLFHVRFMQEKRLEILSTLLILKILIRRILIAVHLHVVDMFLFRCRRFLTEEMWWVHGEEILEKSKSSNF